MLGHSERLYQVIERAGVYWDGKREKWTPNINLASHYSSIGTAAAEIEVKRLVGARWYPHRDLKWDA